MDPLSAGILGGTSLVGSLAGGIINSNASAAALNWNKKVQRETWRREDNAVQRRAADLKAAGMSPLLAAGASAQTSPAAHIGAQEMPDIGGAINSGIAGYQASLQADKQVADISQTDAQTKLIELQQETARKQNQLTNMQIEWYKNHPSYAPGVPSGVHTGTGIDSLFDDVSGRVDRLHNRIINYAPKARSLIKRADSWINRHTGL